MGGLGGKISAGVMGLAIIGLAHICYAQNSPQDFLDAHNAARAEVGVGPMTWSSTVAAYTHNYTDQRIADCQMVHSVGPYGENIAWGTSSLTGTDAVNLWVSEKANYDYNSNSCVRGTCGHYTQVVWRTSVRLGCGRVQCNDDTWFILCNYDPPGNYIGQRPYGVNSDTDSNHLCILAID